MTLQKACGLVCGEMMKRCAITAISPMLLAMATSSRFSAPFLSLQTCLGTGNVCYDAPINCGPTSRRCTSASDVMKVKRLNLNSKQHIQPSKTLAMRYCICCNFVMLLQDVARYDEKDCMVTQAHNASSGGEWSGKSMHGLVFLRSGVLYALANALPSNINTKQKWLSLLIVASPHWPLPSTRLVQAHSELAAARMVSKSCMRRQCPDPRTREPSQKALVSEEPDL